MGTIAFFAARMLYSPYYEAYTTFTVNTVSTVSYNSRNQKNTVTNKMGKIFPFILTSDALKSIVIEDMGYSDSDTFPAEIEASVVKDTNLVTLKVKSDEPQIAYDTLRSVLRNYPSISDVAIGEVTLKQMDESGFPMEPANTPRSRIIAAAAMLLTLVLCLAWLAFKSVTRRTIRTEEELTRYFNAEYLGNMPSVVFKKRSKNQNQTVTIDAEGIPFAFVEAIRTIRHRVEREAQKHKAKVIVVTSALQSEGKTTTSTNLAIALANRKHNVLLVDGDLRNPSILSALGMEPTKKGVVDLLAEKVGVDEVLTPYKDKKHLAILPGGVPTDNPTALWSNENTGKLIKKLRDKCDYVIIDAPPSAIVSDASLIARIADGCVLVVRQDFASIDTLREGMEMFSGTGCKLLGCVLNHAEAGGSGYGYGRYGYGRYGYGRYGYGKSGYGYGYGESGSAKTSEK
jgi:capsular exopolysaccharide synthesis family protein